MGRKFGILGVISSVISYVLLFCTLFMPQGEPSQGGGADAAFAIWLYSAVFSIIAMLLYTIHAFFSLGRGGVLIGVFRLVFTFAVLMLGLSIAGSTNATHGYVWNIVFVINFLLQFLWL